MNWTEWLLALTALLTALLVAFWIGWLIDRRVNPPSHCFDCRRGHHDHSETGTCRRPDCGCET